MPVTADTSGPYAPPSAVLEVVNRRRDRGLSAPITAEVLARAGVSDSLIPRTLQSLQTLDLIDEGGTPTDTFEVLRRAPTAEFQARMQEWLRHTYADVFQFVDPSQDDEIKITDAFRAYEPAGMQRRMVILFQGLCMAAGLMPEKNASRSRTSPSPSPRPQGRGNRPSAPAQSGRRTPSVSPIKVAGALPPAIAGLMESLPSPEAGWTATERDRFIATFKAVLDYAIPVRKPVDQAAE
jgi:hypothetical protein